MSFRVLPVLLALAPPAAAGELTDPAIGEQTRWKPSAACTRPAPPAVGALDDAAERNKAVREFNAYAQRINEYLDCAVEEANRDLVTFRKLVNDSLEAEKASMKTESERLKLMIESGGRK